MAKTLKTLDEILDHEEHLTEAYERLLASDYKLLILALIRDADAPNFYSDLLRYWSSLDDVTGKHAVFAVAGRHTVNDTGYANFLLRHTLDRWPSLKARILPPKPRGRTDWTNLAEANSSQVSDLREFFALGETDIPCLHLTLIAGRANESLALRLRDLQDFSIYTVCKDIMERMGPAFKALDVASSGTKEDFDREVQMFDQVLQNFRSLRSLSSRPIERHSWDYFLSYPSSSRDLARKLFTQLEGLGRVIMDYFCLIAGDDWRSRIPTIQAQSAATVALVTPATQSAHFQISEIHRAIDMYRAGHHMVIPVYSSPGLTPPFGLEQIHGVVAARGQDGDIPALLLEHLRRSTQS